MSVNDRLVRRAGGLRLPRRTVRLRLTLVYGALFLLSSLALLAVTYVLVAQATKNGAASGHIGQPAPHAPPATSQPPLPSSAPPPPLPKSSPGDRDGGNFVLMGEMAKAQREAIMHQLLVQSGVALALMTVISILLGWIIAGRILHRLRTITTTVRHISANNLHERLGFTGPSDELKTLGDTFDSLLARLESSFHAQQQFVANASHELRTPLARQRTLGQLALSDPDPSLESLREAHERILAAGSHQERLIEALLTLARGQTGIDTRRPLDLAAIARNVLSSRADEANYRHVTVHADLNGAPTAGNAGLAERLITNLVDNALRHNIPDGRLHITTGTDPSGNAHVTVSNTGPDVPADEVERLFQPFQRLNDTRTARRDGLGLGLSIVQAIAQAHDAAITTVPGPTGGLTITVTFPPVPAPPHPAPHRTPTPATT
ncbi:putative sensor histidine kinase TcrY [Actinomadura rubteroloni]|uniref:histidine kinase n=1 Tax=Actinomadura rubteroloni TaxID=1926885 RepID=A0A2P4UIV9_9ACTN|nr:HAMP domain-containing sensor histidine kinase [Actinomadura rubteroloni]POM24983.1 putative sensor histidine kinase TcrY [Actinomadura rubteroloni]